MSPTPLHGDARPIVLDNARVVDPSRGIDAPGAVIVTGGVIRAAGPDARGNGRPDGAEVIDCGGAVVAPGLVDLRAFVGEPGHEHRETFASLSRAAAAGGVTTLVTMPDTDPVIDDPALVDFVLRRARDTAVVRIHPLAALTKGQNGTELTEFGLLKEAGALGFTSGRRSVANANVLRRALTYARDFDALVSNLPADADLTGSGVMNLGDASVRLGLPGIPSEAETVVLARDLRLARLAKGRYHAAALSTAESVAMIAWAKNEGIAATAAVAINNVTLNEIDIGAYRTFYKVNPPLRSEDDRRALVQAVADGTIDVIVSNHDPQDVETKRQPFSEAADGAIGVETLLAAGLRLVHSGDLSLSRLIEATATRPARLVGLDAGTLAPGAPADLVVFDLDEPWVLAKEDIVSRAKNSPYEDARFTGRVRRTMVGGRTVFARG
ncbi:dihydroorotase [Oharaeibacter diazotrophicus]|uniref:Dihydroorotase n=1 Tax=Oharaeibacter diazotrophicus TaxID=1920512 RepID=A0A4R6RK28_9HYPH|nr:dihydroorotase [Oharaeibacter diazotrophicus]TDP86792.1 dihydroorotase [Oharaeibacter diazotrophicus]BBE71265.1 dihydroorotase [Pleomorphomonas sp. SM30]GLS78019.1 dihydroorotase [Oharaeibacter diazotrophicus]